MPEVLKLVALRTKGRVQADCLSANLLFEPRAGPAPLGEFVDHLGYFFASHAEDVEVRVSSIRQAEFTKVLVGKDHHLLFLADILAARAHFNFNSPCIVGTAALVDLQARLAVDTRMVGTH